MTGGKWSTGSFLTVYSDPPLKIAAKSVSQLHDKCQLELLAQRSSGHSSLFEKQTSEKRVTSAENFLRQPSWVV